MSNFQKGEVYDVKPDPSVGKEILKKRPSVIVSSNVINLASDLVVVCPITEGVGLQEDVLHVGVRRGEGGCTKDSIVLCDQVKAVDNARLMEKRGNLKVEIMHKIDDGLREVLGLQ